MSIIDLNILHIYICNFKPRKEWNYWSSWSPSNWIQCTMRDKTWTETHCHASPTKPDQNHLHHHSHWRKILQQTKERQVHHVSWEAHPRNSSGNSIFTAGHELSWWRTLSNRNPNIQAGQWPVKVKPNQQIMSNKSNVWWLVLRLDVSGHYNVA